jgi:hypothetical protein
MGEQNIHSMNILTDKHFLKILPYTVMTNGVTMNQTQRKYIHTEEHSNEVIINKCHFGQRHLIGVRISSTTTLLQSSEPGEFNTLLDTSTSDDKNDDNPNENEDNPKKHNIKTYPTMLKLISGSLVGGADYSEIYLDPDDDDALNSSLTNDSDTRKQGEDTKNVPTLPEIARIVAKLQKFS